MRIGVLETGLVSDDLRAQYGSYPEMFRVFMSEAAEHFDNMLIEIVPFSVIKNQFPSNVTACDAWIVTGSKHGVYEEHSWIDPLEVIIRQVVEADIPIVGICFGHQIMAKALGGSVEKFNGGWCVGGHDYSLIEGGFMPQKEDRSLKLLAFHQDQVVVPPQGSTVLMQSDFCQFAALSYNECAISFQPHPEFSIDFVEALTQARRSVVIPDKIADDALNALHDTYDSPFIGEEILRTFK